MDRDDQRAELFRWGIVIGGLLSNRGFQEEFFRVLQSSDGPDETTVGLLAGIERNDVAAVKGFVEQITNRDYGDGDTALKLVLRRVHWDVTMRAMGRSQQILQRLPDMKMSPEQWCEWVEQQKSIVKRLLETTP